MPAAPDSPSPPDDAPPFDAPGGDAPGPDAQPGGAAPISYAAEVSRKALHLLALVVPLTMSLVGRTTSLLLLVPLALLAVTGDVLRVRSAAAARVLYRVFGFMMRAEERPPLGGRVVINGATWVLVSAALLAALFPLRVAVPAFVMFMVSDAAAALVGRRFGQLHWGGNPRTVEGTLAFLVTGSLIMAAFPDVGFGVGLVSVAASAAAEALPRPFNDNLRVPLVAAVVIVSLEALGFG